MLKNKREQNSFLDNNGEVVNESVTMEEVVF